MHTITVEKDMRLSIGGDTTLEAADGMDASIVMKPGPDARIVLNVGKGCRINTYMIQEEDAKVIQTNHIGEGSVVKTYSLWLRGGGGEITNSLEGPGAEAYDVQVFVGAGERTLHLNSILRHAGRGTKGNILVKGIVRDRARAKVDGMIKIEKGGGGAESFLSQHVMLLNPGAHASANPELEIENNDVSSRHAASVSQIDSDKIFYLESRGLSEADSRKLIIEGFLESAIGRVEDQTVRKELMHKTMKAL
ncbi:MAG: SufD family Fe-S cluster assembly protein [Candidatus Micrarchaeia archaeon]